MRLGTMFETGTPSEDELSTYETVTFRELDLAGELVAATFRAFGDFPKFAEVARVYFAAAIWAETLRRLGRKAPEFLLADDREFSEMIYKLRSSGTRRDLLERIDLAGLIDSSRKNWHPARAENLFANAGKIPAEQREIEGMLRRCGF